MAWHLVVKKGVGARMSNSLGQFEAGRGRNEAGREATDCARIVHARGKVEIGLVREVMREYAAGLGVDLCFQNFEQELRSLPGNYRRPRGTLMLALVGGEAAGCIAIRPLAMKFCEMKRLYVRSKWRSQGLGKMLIAAALDDARRAGHRFVRLDTLPTMTAARRLYASLGFQPIAPYYQNPIAGTAFLQLDLQKALH